jgi:ribosomal protein S18 acetylase RimI-like enzyme
MTNEIIKIRKAEKEETDTISNIAVAAWESLYAGMRAEIMNDDLYERLSLNWREEKAKEIRDKMDSNPEEVYVAINTQNNIIGFVTFYINKKTGIGEIANNAVIPELQGKGIGKQLYLYILDIFRQKNLAYAIVRTGYEDSGHARARTIYKKAGFKKMKTSITYSLKL